MAATVRCITSNEEILNHINVYHVVILDTIYNIHIHGIRGWQRMILTHVLLADLWKHSLEHKWTSDRNLQEAFGKLASSTISRISTLCYFLARSKCMY